jgi:hypothetical protein
MSLISAIEAGAKALFTKVETDIKTVIKTPNWTDLAFIALIAFFALLVWNPVKQFLQPTDLRTFAFVFSVWMVCHTYKWGVATKAQAQQAATLHTNQTAVSTTTIATTPATPTASTSK